MTISFRIEDGETFTVAVNEVATQHAVVIPGAPGPAYEGTAWWYGEGPPQTVIGSKKDDYYVDTLTGVVYRLE